MPLDGAYFIKDLNPANPVGTIDKVSLLDDIIREVKGCIVNTFPDMDGEVKYSTDELNEMKENLVHESGEWNFKGNHLVNVPSAKDPLEEAVDEVGVVFNRRDNDKRYLRTTNNLSDIADVSKAFDHLFKTVDYNSEGVKSLKVVMTNLMYPIGSLYLNVQSDQNPAEYLGVGKWVRFAEGRALIGTGELNDGHIVKKFEAGNVTGTYEHTLTVEQMPAHSHSGNVGTGGAAFEHHQHNTRMPAEQWQANSGSTGGGKPHNNMQPSIAVHIWRRTE